MKRIRAIRALLSAGVLAVTVAVGPLVAAKTTDFSDIWSAVDEDGWSVLLVQQDFTIFAAMYVYGPDGQATWYAAALAYNGQDSFVWTGDLFTATGPWFGATPFAPSAVAVNVVGTMTFSSLTDLRLGTLSYTVNGVKVVKQVRRYTFAYENFNGTYSGVASRQGTGATCNVANNSTALPVTVQIAQKESAMAIVTQGNGDTCTFPGTYSQAGHFGLLSGKYACVSGESGIFAFVEMAVSEYDFRSRYRLIDQSGCQWDGETDGIRLPEAPDMDIRREASASRQALPAAQAPGQ